MARSPIPKNKQHQIAQERVSALFEEAQKIFPKDKARAHHYIDLARKIAMKVKLRIPMELKRRYCKHCYSYLQPGVNARVRTRAGKIIISCLECKKFMRIPIR